MIKNAKFSGYYFEIFKFAFGEIIWGDFQICISLPLMLKNINVLAKFKVECALRCAFS